MAYRRDELVHLQAMCVAARPDVVQRLDDLELRATSVYGRYRRCLRDGFVEEKEQAEPPGFERNARGRGFVGAGMRPPLGFSGRRMGPAATVSQFSGEERVVDFGALRRRR